MEDITCLAWYIPQSILTNSYRPGHQTTKITAYIYPPGAPGGLCILFDPATLFLLEAYTMIGCHLKPIRRAGWTCILEEVYTLQNIKLQVIQG